MIETPYIGAAITVGNIGRIADVAVQARHDIAKLDESLAATLADIERRVERLEAGEARCTRPHRRSVRPSRRSSTP